MGGEPCMGVKEKEKRMEGLRGRGSSGVWHHGKLG